MLLRAMEMWAVFCLHLLLIWADNATNHYVEVESYQ